jgi:hypothetical protein
MEEKNRLPAAALLGLLVAIGLAVAGYFVSETLYKGRAASNTVTVKGFAERDVKADLALWQFSYALTGGDLARLYARSSENEKTLTDFLAQKGFPGAEIKLGSVRLEDLLANPYRTNTVSADKRYILRNTISVCSNAVERVETAQRALSDLIRRGIVLTGNSVDFQFTRLNDIKAAMLRDATRNARDAAQQFANDADSRVGSIQSANQGFFSIGSRDGAAQGTGGEGYVPPQASTIDKKVRVVVTLTYYLDR